MWKNNLKLALRVLLKGKGFTVINLLGLAVGFACCLLIGVFIQRELSFDRYHAHSNRLYRLANRVAGASYDNGIAKVCGPWGPEAAEVLPAVEATCRFVFSGESLVSRGANRFFEADGFFADSSVFELFSWPLEAGAPQTALTEPWTIVVTRSLAEKYFGTEDPLGQILTFDNETEYRVTGILAPVPTHSHFTFDFLLSMPSYQHPDRDDWVRWNQFYTYLLLKPGADPAEVAIQVDGLLDQHLPEETAEVNTAFLQPITDIHLYSDLHREMAANSNVSYIYIFGTIAFFILLIACLNFVNLSTARAMQRAREVGVRKVAGASRRVLVGQFLGESLLLTSLAGALAVVLTEFFLPALNAFLGEEIQLHWLDTPVLLWALVGMVVMVGLLSGAFPAFVLSSFRPVAVLRGDFVHGGKAVFRKAMVIAQFAIAIFLLAGTLIVSSQLAFIQNKDLGFEKERLLIIPMRHPEMVERVGIVKSELAQVPGVISVTASGNRPGGSDWGIPYNAVGLPPDQQPAMRCLTIDPEFLETYEMKLATGRGFRPEMPTDSTAYLINETAARQLGWEDPIGQLLEMPAVGRGPGPIVGVVRDFHFRSLHETIGPLYFFMEPGWFSQIAVRVDASRIDETLAGLESVWLRFEPDYPFSFTFFDETYERLYTAEGRTARLIRWFTVLAIFVTCLGLLGLAAHTTERRTKEIGVRRVLGASPAGILGLLSRDFLILVGWAFVLAVVPAWLAARHWLSDFAFHIRIHPGYFLLAGAIAGAVALLTVSWQSWRAARANPVEALRTE